LTESTHVTSWNLNSDEYCTAVLWKTNPKYKLNDQTGVLNLDHAIPSSMHPGGFNVTFCGGSTRFISDRISYETYGRIMTSNGRGARPAGQSITVAPSPAYQGVPLDAQEFDP